MKIKKLLSGNVAPCIGAVLLVIIILTAIFAPVLAPYDPFEMTVPFLKPSKEHLLGTNDIGQDILSELIYGTRVSLIVGITAAVITMIIGTTVGVVAGYYGGVVDRILMSIVNIIIVIPSLPLTIVLVAYLRAGIWNIIIALCVTSWAGTARLIRSRVMAIRQESFVSLEKTLGMSDLYIMTVHILPNIMGLIMTRGALSVASAMLSEAGLSFLGLGAIGQKSWGSIINNAFTRNGVINNSYWWYYPPIICICLSVIAFMLISTFDDSSNSSETLMMN